MYLHVSDIEYFTVFMKMGGVRHLYISWQKKYKRIKKK